MTIASALTAMNTDIQNARTAITNKGGTVTSGGGSSQLATDIATIPSGGSAPVITSLNVTPTTSAQTITAPSGIDGYNTINVAAVTSSIDNNIVAGNIKSGVSILGVTGTVTELNGETQTVSLTSSAGNTFTPSSGKNAITSITVTPNNQARSVTPSTSSQTLSVNSGYSGNGTISVSAVTSSIDANIQAGNIKKDVQILGVTGTYEGSGGGGDSGAGRVFNANFWVNTRGVVSNYNTQTGQLSALSQSLSENQMSSVFFNSSDVFYADFSNIQNAGNQAFNNCFRNSTSISKIDLKSLSIVGSFCLQRMLMGTTQEIDIYFNSLNTSSFSDINAFFQMCRNTTNSITIHFPSNMQATISGLTDYPSFGGSAVTLAFDLPATS